MCIASTPTVSTPAVQAPIYMHNPFLDDASLDGTDMTTGRNSLVNSPGSPDYDPTVPGYSPQVTVQAVRQATTPATPATPAAPAAVTGVAASAAPAGVQAAAPTPIGQVIPTIGGALAGALPPTAAAVGGVR